VECNVTKSIIASCSTIIDVEFVVYIAIVEYGFEWSALRAYMTEIANLLDVRQKTRLHNRFNIDDIPWGRDTTG
jgi:hypothetical protein